MLDDGGIMKAKKTAKSISKSGKGIKKVNLNKIAGGINLDNVYSASGAIGSNLKEDVTSHDFSRWDKVLSFDDKKNMIK